MKKIGLRLILRTAMRIHDGDFDVNMDGAQ